jgi:cobalt-zinc-cadmium efflux system membrane fusion protein
MEMKSIVLYLGLGSAALAAGCGGSTQPSGAAQPGSHSANAAVNDIVASDARGIQMLTLKTAAIPEYLELPAHIEADPTRVVHVFAPAGGRITEMKVRPWDRVQKGQPLAKLESSDLSRAVADYHKARTDNEVKQKGLARAEDLLAHHAIAEKDYLQAQADAQMAQAEQNTARDRIRVLGADPEHATNELQVVAPRAGVVLDTGAATGEFSKSLDAPAPLCTIADISTVWAVGEVYEKDLISAKSGQSAEISLNAYPERHWPGRVNVISDAVDPTTRTLRVRVVLANPDGRLKPSMFGSIRLLRSTSQGILVPSAAVIREGSAAYVFVKKAEGRFQRRAVSLGRTVDDTVEILSGLDAGATVVTDGALLLQAVSSNPS